MLGTEEGEMLLARLDPIDRASLDSLVESFVRDELPSESAGCITYAVNAFEERAADLPEPQRRVVLRFAAALRERLARMRCH